MASLLLLVPLLLAPGLFDAELLLPGGQSRLDIVPDVPDFAPVVALVPDLLSLLVLPVSAAIAAVPRVNATIEAAVRRRRFIRCPPCECDAPERKAAGTLRR